MQIVTVQPNALPAFPLIPGQDYTYYAGGPGNPGPIDSPVEAPDQEPPADEI